MIKAFKESQVHLELRVLSAQKERLDSKELEEMWETQEHQAVLETKVLRERMEPKELQDLEARLESRVMLDLKDHRDLMAATVSHGWIPKLLG